MPEQVKKILVLSIYFALALSTLAVFWQVRNFDFTNFDDNEYVYENPHVLNGLTPDGTIWAFTSNRTFNWHPLTWLSLMLDCQLFGNNPGRMHLVNLFLHIANTLLLFAIFKKITGSLWPSAFVAAAFALHPMHVESVAWIAERKDVLSTLFMLLTLAAYVGYVRRRGMVRYLLTILLFALGLLAKPMLVTLPFLLLLLDYWPLNRFAAPRTAKTAAIANRRQILYRIIIEKIPFFVLAAASSVITFLVQRGAMANISTTPLNDRIANSFLSYAKYIGKMFWPQNLAALYPFDAGIIQPWQVLLCLMLMIVITMLVIYFGRRYRYLPVGWFWLVGTLVPVIGFIQVGSQAYADRYTYIPYVGLFIMIAWGIPELLSKWPYRKLVLGISAAIVLTVLGICARWQVSYWNNSVTLFSHAVEVTQNNYLAYGNLGHAYNKLGRYQDAIESYKQAIIINPDHTTAYYNLGNALYSLGRWKEAMEPYKQVIMIEPNYADALCNLGNTYNKLGRQQDAIESYKQAIRIKSDNADAHFNLGTVYCALGRYQDAIEPFKQAVRIKPDFADAYCNLGNTYGSLGRYQDAIESFKQAIKIKPDYVDAHHNLGVAYLMTDNKDSAIEEYKILKTLDVEQANKLFNLISK